MDSILREKAFPIAQIDTATHHIPCTTYWSIRYDVIILWPVKRAAVVCMVPISRGDFYPGNLFILLSAVLNPIAISPFVDDCHFEIINVIRGRLARTDAASLSISPLPL